MVCPFCLHSTTSVSNSRQGARLNAVWRRRRCLACKQQFTTYEHAEASTIITITDKKQKQPFSRTKLLMRLLQSCDHRPDTDVSVPYLADTIEQKLYRLAAKTNKKYVQNDQLANVIADTLHAYDPVAYVKFISRHSNNINTASLRKLLPRKPS